MKLTTLFLAIFIACCVYLAPYCESKRIQNVHDRRLVLAKTTASSIVKEHALPATKTGNKLFEGTALGYVTPWNNKGYDIAKKFNCKFNIISPTWYRLVPTEKAKQVSVELTGQHDVDQQWITDVRETTACPNTEHKTRIAPRILLDGWPQQLYQAMFSTDDNNAYVDSIISNVVDEAKSQNFDGFVLDAGYLSMRAPWRNNLVRFIKSLAEKLHENNGILVLVVPPYRGGPDEHSLFNHDDFVELAPSIDFFSMMTYDFSSGAGRPGANAPFGWVVQTVMHLMKQDQQAIMSAGKLLIGLNFYGYEFSKSSGKAEALLGPKVIEILEEHRPKLTYDEAQHEHFFEYKTYAGTTHVVWFPTLKSIDDRIQFAKEVNVGLAVWELGQGLDYFYDLL